MLTCSPVTAACPSVSQGHQGPDSGHRWPGEVSCCHHSPALSCRCIASL
ncbi:unnamed protein product [Musa banksii]